MLRKLFMNAGLAGFCLAALSSPVHAQSSFNVAGKEVQVHGAIQQGFIFTDNNNFLTMDTSSGSGAMTDAAVNASSQISSKLRVGAQLYSRNIGELGNGQVQFDWAYADYRFNDAIGIRAGKVKTPLGLFNDTQDMEFLYTWALLPQGIYATDLRAVTIAHVGADVYGSKAFKKAGTFSYTVYGGTVPDDARGGYRYGIEDSGMAFRQDIQTRGAGLDLRWTAPMGLMAGYSMLATKADLELTLPTYFNLPVQIDITNWNRHALFADYQKDSLRISAELRQVGYDARLTPAVSPSSSRESRGWFVAGSYRLNDKVELGTYYTRYVSNTALDSGLESNHISGPVVSARFDINRFWHVKAETHFVEGYGDPVEARGFYLRSNPSGFDAQTKMLVLRTGVSF